MSLSTSIHDVKTLVLSFHPVIAIETVEEDRVFSLLQSTALELRMPFFEWSITTGLVRVPGPSSMYGTAEPMSLLSTLHQMDTQAPFLLKDFARFTTDHTVARQLREISQKFSKNRSTIVLSGATIRLSPEIEHDVVYYHLNLPEREELRKVFNTVLHSLVSSNRVEVLLDTQDREELVTALSGMTLNQARQTIAFAALKDGTLSAGAIKEILERKAQVIQESGLLEYFPVEDNRFQLGGFARLKSWLVRARTGFSREARELNLPTPRGILIVGVQGCGKSLAAKVIAREWKLPLVKLDAGRLLDQYIGESD